MKTLILMRHAKSDWGFAEPDHDRPLNKRGRRAATALGHWLREQGIMPDEALCSTALRTRETLTRLDLSTPTRMEPRLYHAAPETMRAVLLGARGACVLMLGHNPGIAGFARDLVKTPPEHPRFSDYPTGATLVVQFDIPSWQELVRQTGTVRAFVVPRELNSGADAP